MYSMSQSNSHLIFAKALCDFTTFFSFLTQASFVVLNVLDEKYYRLFVSKDDLFWCRVF